MGNEVNLKEVKDPYDTQTFLLDGIQIAIVLFLPLKILCEDHSMHSLFL